MNDGGNMDLPYIISTTNEIQILSHDVVGPIPSAYEKGDMNKNCYCIKDGRRL